MTTRAPTTHHSAPPTGLLIDLRRARTQAATQIEPVLGAWALRPLSGGRNNDVYAWNGPEGPICIKLYRKNDDRQRLEREWHALTALAHQPATPYAPKPLWRDDHAYQPAIGMSLIPGTPITDLADIAPALKTLATATRAMQATPLTGPLATTSRIDSAEHYLTRLTHTWPQQLAEHPNDPLTRDMLRLLDRWRHHHDCDTLTHPAPPIFSRGDANLLNWHHDGTNIYCVDFEYSGYSDTAFDAADQIEHISARNVPDHTWHSLKADLGIHENNRARFDAAQRTIALRWLAVLWKQRTRRTAEFTTQLDRAKSFLY